MKRSDIAQHLKPLPAFARRCNYTEGLRRSAVRLAGRVGVPVAAHVYGCAEETLQVWMEIVRDFELTHSPG